MSTTDNTFNPETADAKGFRAEYEKLLSEVSSLKSERNERVLNEFLTEKGVKPGVAKFIPKEIQGDKDALAKWLDDEADTFGIVPSTEQPGEAPGQQSAANNEEIQNAQRLQSAQRASHTPEAFDDYKTRIDNAKSIAEVNAIEAEAKGLTK